jgi:quercetin dioxygenase-like cupin family protein
MADVIQQRSEERRFVPTEVPGVEISAVRSQPEGGATYFLRFAEGAVGPPHTHPAGEELFVVQGEITVGGVRLKTGDYLYTPPDEAHDAIAHTASIILLSAPKRPVFL